MPKAVECSGKMRSGLGHHEERQRVGSVRIRWEELSKMPMNSWEDIPQLHSMGRRKMCTPHCRELYGSDVLGGRGSFR